MSPGAARRLLSENREAFIAACPSLGLRKRLARYCFGSPRELRECLSIFDAWQMHGEPPAVKARLIDLAAGRVPESNAS